MATKQERIQFLRKQFEMLGKNRENLEMAANELNNALSKKRKVVIIKKVSELGSKLWSELLSNLKSELESELWSKLGFELWAELSFGLRSELKSELGFELMSELGSELRFELGFELRSELGSELKSELRHELWSELGLGLRSELWSELMAELGSELRFELGFELLWLELRSELWSELWSELGPKLGFSRGSKLRLELEYSAFKYYEVIWVLFINEFYPHLKTLQRNKKKIEALKKISEAGNAYILISKKNLYILPFPEIHVNERKRLHNLNGYALKFLDKETYWIDGVKFDKDLWEKVVQKQLSAIDILKLKNQEQKIVALKIYGWDRIVAELKPKVLDRKWLLINGEVLEHQVLEVSYNGWVGRFLKYVCPSTNKEGLLRVDHRIDETKTVEGARAWGFKPILTFVKADSLEFGRES
jgi:hypothetical protein